MPKRFWFVSLREQRIMRRRAMRAPYGLEIIESCLSCPHREERLFCNLSPPALKRLASITSAASYPKDATLFVEGQKPRGVFVVCTGRVKLSTSSADGKTLILRVVDPGEVLGVAETLSGTPYQTTADILEPSQANFIGREDFMSFLREHGEAALRVAQQLSEDYHLALSEMRTIGLSHSAAEKFARFLLDWTEGREEQKGEIRLKMTLTHEEIAQMIGASRETVTRLFADFKRRQLLDVKGSTVVIHSRTNLESLSQA